ncbi:hypothetical protein HYW55_06075 [Candidatus Gottesmanbacteria bacterium]|nr:hypothetical protein [Candidatus Gottesmanbacteria bacterium]
MTSSRFILIFLGFIFIIIILLTSNRIAGALRSRFGRFIPSIFPITASGTPTPTNLAEVIPTQTPPSTPTPYTSRFPIGTQSTTKGGVPQTAKSSTTNETPATGPESIAFVLLGGSFLTGSLLKRFSQKKSSTPTS